MTEFFKKILRFLSSVKLAVPLMTIIIGVIAYGTVVESMYNADMARLKVYQTSWFGFLMGLLWINILFAALSRWPWKIRHLGFLITHLGLLVLLIGGVITGVYGTDGSLRLMEGEEGNTVVLPDLVLGISSGGNSDYSFYPIKRSLDKQNKNYFDELNSKLASVASLEAYYPFAERGAGFSSSGSAAEGPVVVEFKIKSPFFDVEQWLHSENQKMLNMGPAQFTLSEELTANLAEAAEAGKMKVAKKSESPSSAKKPMLIIKRKDSGQVLKTLVVEPKMVGAELDILGVSLKVSRIFQRAQVGAQGINENPSGGANPALELSLSKEGQTFRDIVFAKFPGFSLLTDNKLNLAFDYQAEAGGAAPVEVPSGSPPPMADIAGASNHVRFSFNRAHPEELHVVLEKKGEVVLDQKAKLGDVITTPWMGMQLTIKNIYWNAVQKDEVKSVEPALKVSVLPPSAVLLSPAFSAPSAQKWIVEGEEGSFIANDKEYGIYFGRKVVSLPFKLKLLKFSKIDYPGSTMPKSYESRVVVSDTQKETLISMNEPLEYQGYTVYQSSYEELTNGSFASVFSVNKDPGRGLKYAGSLILCLGIIIFTLMRSRWYLKRRSSQ